MKPILFNGDMVRAIMAGNKTQTRRIAKPRFDGREPCEHWLPVDDEGASAMSRHCEHGSEWTPCPHGQPGDALWVRETWRTPRSLDHVAPSMLTTNAPIIYEADQWNDGFPRGFDKGKGRPSIFMPRWACRLTVRIKSVRVERLRDISENDAMAEGIITQAHGYGVEGLHMTLQTRREAFGCLWDSINAKPGVTWSANPWVWVIAFSRIGGAE